MENKNSDKFIDRDLRLPIKLLISFEGGNLNGNYFIENLSSGGLFVAIERPLAIGTIIKIQFVLPHNREEHTVEARVTWVRTKTKGALLSGMGISFEGLGSEQEILLKKAIIQYKEIIDG